MHRSRSLFAIAALTVIAMIAAACGNSSSSSTSGDEGGGANEVTFMIAEGPEELETFEQIVEAFNESQDETEVTLIPLSEDEDLGTRLSTDIAAGNAPDIFFDNYRYIDGFVAKGTLEPLDSYIEGSTVDMEGLYPTSVEAYNFDGKQYCLPFNASSLVVYYRSDLFEQAKVKAPTDSWTWAEFQDAAETLTAGDVYGVGVDPQLIRVAPFVWSAGGKLTDKEVNPTRFTLGTGPALVAMQSFLDLPRLKVTPPEAMVEAEGLESMFVNGELAMMLESRKVVPEFRSAGDFEWDVAPLPQFKKPMSILHSDGYCITEGSENKDAAFDFIEFALSPEGQEIGAKSGRAVPSLISVAESESFLDPSAKPANSQVFLDNLEHTQRVPVVINWAEVEDVANGIIEEAFHEGEGAAEVAVQIDKQTRPLLEVSAEDATLSGESEEEEEGESEAEMEQEGESMESPAG